MKTKGFLISLMIISIFTISCAMTNGILDYGSIAAGYYVEGRKAELRGNMDDASENYKKSLEWAKDSDLGYIPPYNLPDGRGSSLSRAPLYRSVISDAYQRVSGINGQKTVNNRFSNNGYEKYEIIGKVVNVRGEPLSNIPIVIHTENLFIYDKPEYEHISVATDSEGIFRTTMKVNKKGKIEIQTGRIKTIIPFKGLSLRTDYDMSREQLELLIDEYTPDQRIAKYDPKKLTITVKTGRDEAESFNITKRGTENYSEEQNIKDSLKAYKITRQDVIGIPETFTVTSTGVGQTEEEALNNAFRNAIEQVIGAMVYSETIVRDMKLINDSIAVYSKGYITDYTVLSKQKYDALYSLKVKSTVSTTPIKTYLQKNQLNTWDDIIKGIILIKNAQEKIIKGVNMMKVYLGDTDAFLKRAYSFNIVGYKISNINSSSVSGYYVVEIQMNSPFWDEYNKALSLIDLGYREEDLYDHRMLEGGNVVVRSPKKTVIESKVIGYYSIDVKKRYKSMYVVPVEIPMPPKISIKFNDTVLTIDMNSIDVSQRGYYEGIDKILEGYSVYYDEVNARVNHVAFNSEKPIIIKVPFSTNNIDSVKHTLSANTVPWDVKVIKR